VALSSLRPGAVSDLDLARRAAEGEGAAFDELYRRHVEAAYRVARAVTRNDHDASDAVSEAFTRVFTNLRKNGGDGFSSGFRPYLLAASRNAGIDILRRSGRTLPTEPEGFERPDGAKGPAAALIAGSDSAMVLAALEQLPERWRTILWLTEVEGMAPREAAPVMGLSPNGASQLAVRARAGLREAYLQAHLRKEVAPACEETTPLLGAYVAGGLAARDIAKVDQHLAGCEACQGRVAELQDVGDRLRRVVVPIPLVLAAGGGGLAAKLGLASGGAAGDLFTAGLGSKAQMLAKPLQKPLLYSSVGLFALSIMAVAVVGGPQGRDGTIDSRPSPVAGSPSPATLEEDNQFSLPIAFGDPIPAPSGGAAPVRFGSSSTAVVPPGSGNGGGSGGSGNGTPPPPPTPKPEPVANAQVIVGPAGTAGVSAGAGDGSCTGFTVLGNSAGCAPAKQPTGRTATVVTDGSIPGEREVSL
jgi:RNA polymerase sigma factor (sigma-70 family)